jgi:hypothetical protein
MTCDAWRAKQRTEEVWGRGRGLDRAAHVNKPINSNLCPSITTRNQLQANEEDISERSVIAGVTQLV